MNTEQMNRVSIEDLDKIKSEYDLMCAYTYGHVYNDFEQYYNRDVLNKCIWFEPLYWSVIMPVWQKLRGELVAIENLENNKDEYYIWLDKAMLFGKSRAYTQLIEKAIAQDTDLPIAHKLIHEAIHLIKK